MAIFNSYVKLPEAIWFRCRAKLWWSAGKKKIGRKSPPETVDQVPMRWLSCGAELWSRHLSLLVSYPWPIWDSQHFVELLRSACIFRLTILDWVRIEILLNSWPICVMINPTYTLGYPQAIKCGLPEKPKLALYGSIIFQATLTSILCVVFPAMFDYRSIPCL